MMPNIKDVFLRLVLESDFFITGSSFLFNQNQNGFLRYYMEFYPPLWSSYRSRTLQNLVISVITYLQEN
jgi:hypothetical protein